MKAVYALLLCLSIVGRTAIFLALVLGLLVLSPFIVTVKAAIDSLTIRLRSSLRRSKRPAGLPHGSCESLSDDFIASIVTSRDSIGHDRRK